MDRIKLRDWLQEVTERYRADGYFPDAAVRVFDSRGTLAAVSAGRAKEGSLFDAASLTKIATTAQILLLADRGRLSLTDRLDALFPEIAGDRALKERIGDVTVYGLLTHTSSIAAWYPFYAHRELGFFEALKEALARTAPVTGVEYSDINFMLLGQLLTRLTGLPLDECLQETLVKPYGLGNMRYLPDPKDDIVPSSYGNGIEMRMCRERGIAFDGWRPEEEPVRGEVNDGNSWYYFHGVAGHAGIFADAEAYERLCRLFMTAESPLFSVAQREQKDAPGRGIGLQTGPSYPRGCGHTGFTGTGIYFSSERDIGIVTMTNRLFYRKDNEQLTSYFRRAVQEAVYAIAVTNGCSHARSVMWEQRMRIHIATYKQDCRFVSLTSDTG